MRLASCYRSWYSIRKQKDGSSPCWSLPGEIFPTGFVRIPALRLPTWAASIVWKTWLFKMSIDLGFAIERAALQSEKSHCLHRHQMELLLLVLLLLLALVVQQPMPLHLFRLSCYFWEQTLSFDLEVMFLLLSIVSCLCCKRLNVVASKHSNCCFDS